MDSSLDRETLRYYNQDIIAKACIGVLYNLSKEENAFSKLFSAKETFERTYPENNVLKNATVFFLSGLHKDNIKEKARENTHKITKELSDAAKNISLLANKKIRENSSVFFHSINNHIYDIAKEAKGAKFSVLEHPQQPINKNFYEKFKKNAKIYPDLSLKDAILEADVCILGAEGINKKGVIVKKGSSLIAAEAKANHIPLYVCASTHRHTKDSSHNKDLFEHLPNEMLTGIILEHGIFDPKHGYEESRLFHLKA